MWVTVDRANLGVDGNGNQPYRIRASGTAVAPGPPRASMEKLDNQLRKISLKYNRVAGGNTANPQATRTIEVVALPTSQSIWVRGLLMKNVINMSGGGWIDSFDPTSPFKSTNGLYDIAKRQTNGDIATVNSTGSDLRGTYVYGDLAYSGPAVKNTSNVQGTISTPFTASIPDVSAPVWPNGTFTSLSNGNPGTLYTGTQASPAKYKIGNLTVSGGNVLNILPSNPGEDNYIEVWVTGKLTTSGSGYIQQAPNVYVKYYVGDDITVSGSSFSNQSGRAKNLSIVAYGSGKKVTVSGSGSFIGTINAPNNNFTISGDANYSGAFIGNNITISGGASVHYDESLKINGNSASLGNYAYGNWFEDNSQVSRGQTY